LRPEWKAIMKNQILKACLIVTAIFFGYIQANAQAGITASPTRLYFKPGNKQEQTVMVTNPHKDKTLEVGVAINDWGYDSLGNNLSYEAGTLPFSCAKNVKVLPGSYFTLSPGETKELSITVTGVPDDKNIPVRTAMLYLTQLNPGDAKAENGAAIKVTVRMGIKIYYTTNAMGKPNVEISNFIIRQDDGKINGMKLYVDNNGDMWLNGNIHYDLLNKETGKKYKIPAIEFYSLPGDKRMFESELPPAMEKGKYTATAIVNYGSNDELKIAELDFTY
jgi:P pilus assembly chaperone PapD